MWSSRPAYPQVWLNEHQPQIMELEVQLSTEQAMRTTEVQELSRKLQILQEWKRSRPEGDGAEDLKSARPRSAPSVAEKENDPSSPIDRVPGVR